MIQLHKLNSMKKTFSINSITLTISIYLLIYIEVGYSQIDSTKIIFCTNNETAWAIKENNTSLNKMFSVKDNRLVYYLNNDSILPIQHMSISTIFDVKDKSGYYTQRLERGPSGLSYAISEMCKDVPRKIFNIEIYISSESKKVNIQLRKL